MRRPVAGLALTVAAAGRLPGTYLQLQLSVLFAALHILRAGYIGLSSEGVSKTCEQTVRRGSEEIKRRQACRIKESLGCGVLGLGAKGP